MTKTIHEKLQLIIELNEPEKEQLNAFSLVLKAVEKRLQDTTFRKEVEKKYEDHWISWRQVRPKHWRICTKNENDLYIPMIEAKAPIRMALSNHLNDFLDEIIKELHESAQKLKKG